MLDADEDSLAPETANAEIEMMDRDLRNSGGNKMADFNDEEM
jgi:hypothetical protein